jgi:hypothetical protein
VRCLLRARLLHVRSVDHVMVSGLLQHPFQDAARPTTLDIISIAS